MLVLTVCVVYDACMYGKGLVWMLGDFRIHEVGRLWIPPRGGVQILGQLVGKQRMELGGNLFEMIRLELLIFLWKAEGGGKCLWYDTGSGYMAGFCYRRLGTAGYMVEWWFTAKYKLWRVSKSFSCS